MSMSRKDFELIAKTIKNIPLLLGRELIAEYFAVALVGHSATFDRERFLAACKPKEKTHA